MRQAYLVMAHANSEQLEKLFRLLDNCDVDIFLLLDAKAREFDISRLRACLSFSTLKLLSRMKITWGGDSQIAAELALLQAAVSGKYDYYHLISGMDLPLKTNAEIVSFLESHNGMEFVSVDQIEPLGDVQAARLPDNLRLRIGTFGWIDRVRYWHPFQNQFGRAKGAGLASRMLEMVQNLVGIDRLADVEGFLAKGPNWFSITHDLAMYIVGATDDIMYRFGSSVCADEIFLQTIIINSSFVGRLYHGEKDGVPDSLRYVDWERGNPYTFRAGDLEELKGTSALFARKFDQSVDKNIVDDVCNWLHKK